MADVLCILMGMMDVAAGIIVLLFLFHSQFAMIFGIAMILKGVMSLGLFRLFA